MISQGNNPAWETARGNSTDESVAGEEDPGAAGDALPPGGGQVEARDPGGTRDDVCAARGSPSAVPHGDEADGPRQLRKAILRWENEGGAAWNHAAAKAPPEHGRTEVDLTNAELVQLQLRVIALENLVTALLAAASGETTGLARALAAYISPRPGATPHHLTIQAAAQMVHLVERANLVREHPDLRPSALDLRDVNAGPISPSDSSPSQDS